MKKKIKEIHNSKDNDLRKYFELNSRESLVKYSLDLTLKT